MFQFHSVSVLLSFLLFSLFSHQLVTGHEKKLGKFHSFPLFVKRPRLAGAFLFSCFVSHFALPGWLLEINIRSFFCSRDNRTPGSDWRSSRWLFLSSGWMMGGSVVYLATFQRFEWKIFVDSWASNFFSSPFARDKLLLKWRETVKREGGEMMTSRLWKAKLFFSGAVNWQKKEANDIKRDSLLLESRSSSCSGRSFASECYRFLLSRFMASPRFSSHHSTVYHHPARLSIIA